MPVRSEPTLRPRLHHHVSARRDRALFATLGFVVGVLVTRGITTVLHYRGAGPNGGIVIGGVHIHHMVFGIILLLGDSYAWLLLTAIDHEHHRRRSRLSAAVYGVAGALILDEFALWLNLRDVYWQRQGRESVDALAAFAALLAAASIAGPFLSALAKHHRKSKPTPPNSRPDLTARDPAGPDTVEPRSHQVDASTGTGSAVGTPGGGHGPDG